MGAMVNDQTEERLQRMLATGLWGDTLDAVMESLVAEGVRRACADGLIQVWVPPSRPGTMTFEVTGVGGPGAGGGGGATPFSVTAKGGPPSAAPEILAKFAEPPPMAVPENTTIDPDYAARLEAAVRLERDGPAYDNGMVEEAPTLVEAPAYCNNCGSTEHLGVDCPLPLEVPF